MIEQIIAELKKKVAQGPKRPENPEGHSERYLQLTLELLTRIQTTAKGRDSISSQEAAQILKYIEGLRFKGSGFFSSQQVFGDLKKLRRSGTKVPKKDYSDRSYSNKLLREIEGDLGTWYRDCKTLYRECYARERLQKQQELMQNYYKPGEDGTIQTTQLSTWKTGAEKDARKPFKPESVNNALYKDFTRDARVDGHSAPQDSNISKDQRAKIMSQRIDTLLGSLKLEKKDKVTLASAIKNMGGQEMTGFIIMELKTALLGQYAMGSRPAHDINWRVADNRILCDINIKLQSLQANLEPFVVDATTGKIKAIPLEEVKDYLQSHDEPVYKCQATVELTLNSSGQASLNVVKFSPSYCLGLKHRAESQQEVKTLTTSPTPK